MKNLNMENNKIQSDDEKQIQNTVRVQNDNLRKVKV